ncbi:DNA-methyltransferase [Caulobacter sp. DWP3-1-3b2]|uniref:DNA-methyltransferase n=1 Tax=Caulobacter sp. DWP3-1-3b2 TaxID=2804643 RepID=UPI003CFAA33A
MQPEAVRLLCGDALQSVQQLPAGKFNLIISSPPYNIGKSYERSDKLTLEEYTAWQETVAEALVNTLAEDGSICWQVGNYVKDGELVPLDIIFYNIFKSLGLRLRNRIIWRYNFGYNADRRFSGRYETVLWFTKTDSYKFNLDPVRIPQIYPGKRHSAAKGERAGKPSGNPRGKNPSDYWEFSADKDFKENPVWDIPNVKAGHPERTDHPCQFPVELVERCVLALTDPGDNVLDPFVGAGASVIAAEKHGRVGFGIDKEPEFIKIASERLALLKEGALPLRPLGRPVRRPQANERVATTPAEWLAVSEV